MREKRTLDTDRLTPAQRIEIVALAALTIAAVALPLFDWLKSWWG